jgi:5'-deoxynucleotidase YfbR-like HD superfamily hydrolase
MKCTTSDCPNDSDAGRFVGATCAPCHDFISNGKMNKSKACEDYKKLVIASSLFMAKSRGARHMTRFQNSVRITDNNVAEHIGYVALYTMLICNIFGVDDAERCTAIEFAVLHDIHEGISLEIPANVKRVCRNPVMAIEDRAKREMFVGLEEIAHNIDLSMTDEIKAIVKLADLIDALAYVAEELKMGNKFFNPHALEIKGALHKQAKALGEYYERVEPIMHFKNVICGAFGLDTHYVSESDKRSTTHIHKGFEYD